MWKLSYLRILRYFFSLGDASVYLYLLFGWRSQKLIRLWVTSLPIVRTGTIAIGEVMKPIWIPQYDFSPQNSTDKLEERMAVTTNTQILENPNSTTFWNVDQSKSKSNSLTMAPHVMLLLFFICILQRIACIRNITGFSNYFHKS